MLSGHNIIVIGASAGGVEALTSVIRELPPTLAAAVCVVLHIPAEAPSVLPAILSRAGHLPAVHPQDGTKVEHGHIYVAPPDHHLLLEDGYLRVVHGPRENRHRPAIDPLFRSAARSYGSRVIGVILTGSLDDGVAGLLAIKRRGGIAVVQDPHEALFPDMPRNALRDVQVDYTVRLAECGQLLTRLTHEVADDASSTLSPDIETEAKIAAMEIDTSKGIELLATPSAFSCPECGGVLWEVPDGAILRFRCRVGHAFSADSIQAEHTEALENALWVALKILEERIELAQRLTRRATTQGQPGLIEHFTTQQHEAEVNATALRQILTRGKTFNVVREGEKGDAVHPKAASENDDVAAEQMNEQGNERGFYE